MACRLPWDPEDAFAEKEKYSVRKVAFHCVFRLGHPLHFLGSSGSDPEQSLLMEMLLNKAEALFDKAWVGTRWPTGTLPGREMSSLSVRPVSY